VIVTGGNTLLPGFVERLSADTVNLLNSQQPNLGSKLGFLAPRTSTERLFASWIGGE
jgi:actin-related protein